VVELVRSESFDRLVEKINASLDELLESIKCVWTKLGPIIDLEVAREPRGSSRTIEHGCVQGLEPGQLSLSGLCWAPPVLTAGASA
jgi:hypothetical protein